jgi:diguanylate cyclase (GGDEF)-like protein/PAS domain S-box-containing protein
MAAQWPGRAGKKAQVCPGLAETQSGRVIDGVIGREKLMKSVREGAIGTSALPDSAAALPAFRLLRYFSAASFIVILIATGLLTGLQHRLAVQDLVYAQEEHHGLLTRSVASGHWEEFSGLFKTAGGLDAEALRQHPEVARLQALFQREFSGTQVLKLKIYDMAGRTVFSTDPRQIGEDKSGNAGFQAARDGQPASELTHRNEFSSFEQVVGNVDLVASYIPIQSRDARGTVEAVFEIYSDTTPMLMQIRKTRAAVALQVTAVLIGLYLALFFIVRHADRVIRAQDAQRRLDEEKLHNTRRQLALSEEFHRALIENLSDAVMLLGEDLRIIYSAPANSRVLGIPEDRLVGMALTDYASEDSRGAVASWLVSAIAAPGVPRRVEFKAVHEALGSRYFMATATNLRDHTGIDGIVVNVQDFTERKLAEIEVQQLAQFDGLTGLARREYFVQQMRKTLARVARNKELLALMFLDLDGFKAVNDNLGHEIGDKLLKEVSVRIRSALRLEDEVARGGRENGPNIARLGGDEFTVLLTNLDHPGSAGLVAERILAAIAAPYVFGDITARVTSSVGIAIYDGLGLNCEDLIKQADTAMYLAKQKGKNTFCFYGDVTPQRAVAELSLV